MNQSATTRDRARAVDRDAVRDFLVGMYGTEAEGWLVPSWPKIPKGMGCEFVPGSDIDAAVDVFVRHAPNRDTYIGMGLRRAKLGEGKRGEDIDVLSIPGVRLDVDYGTAGHKDADGNAPDLDTALAIVGAMPLAPTVVISTGGGVQAHWAFPSPVAVDESPIDLAWLLKAWEAFARSLAVDVGKVDSVADLARILRVPGTLNHKLDEPRAVTIIEADWSRRYPPEVIAAVIPAEEREASRPAADPEATLPHPSPVHDADGFTKPPSIFQRYNAEHGIADLIVDDGAAYLRTDNKGRAQYGRPGKETEQSGNVLGNGLYVHSKAWTVNGVTLEKGAYSPARYVTETRHGGDFAAFAASLDESEDNLFTGTDTSRPVTGSEAPPNESTEPPERTPTTWKPQDIGPILRGEQTELPPDQLTRTDGVVSLFYRNKVNAVHGEPEAGKGWAVILACKQALERGERVLYADFEDAAVGVVGRLRDVCVPDDDIAALFHYVKPDEPISDDAWTDIEPVLSRGDVALVILDGVTEVMELHGLDLGSNTDVATFLKLLPRRLAKYGCAVVEIDHVVKNADTRGRYAIGGQHKLAGIDGAAYSFDVVRPFGRGREGLTRISVKKDRPGFVRQHSIGKDRIAEMHLHSDPDGGVHIDLRPPADVSDFRPTVLMERLSRHIETYAGQSQRDIFGEVSGDDKAKRTALALLVEGDYVKVEPEGRAHRHVSIRPFRDGLVVGDDAA